MIIAMIPAKAESKRLPGKNMKMLLGRPMIDYTIEYAKGCKMVDEIYVSTDSKEIAEYARKKGVKVVMRPPELSEDGITQVDIMKHCVSSVPNSGQIRYLVNLLVDHPDRGDKLDKFIKLALDQDIPDLFTVGKNGVINGSVRIVRKKDLMEDRISRRAMAVGEDSTNIHVQADFNKAEKRLKKQKRQGSRCKK